MKIVWSRMIERFAPTFGISKAQVEDAFNKPDKSEVVGGTYVTVKFYDGYAVLITFYYAQDKVHFMNAYKIFPGMVKADVGRAGAVEILTSFMDVFGMDVDLPGVGKVKTHVNEKSHEFFQGILDVEKYVRAANGKL